MNRSIKKIALSLLLAFAAIVLCVLGSSIINGKSVTPAEAASASVTDIKIEADKTSAGVGDTITFTVTVSSGYSAPMCWTALAFVVSPLGSDGMAIPDIDKYFIWDQTFGTDGKDINLMAWDDDLGDYTYYYFDFSNYVAGDSTLQSNGFSVQIADQGNGYLMTADKPVVIKYKLKVADNIPNGKLTFGVSALNGNAVQYNTEAKDNVVEHHGDANQFNVTPAEIFIG